MVDERYVSDDPEILQFHVMEECAELIEQANIMSNRSADLIKQICKANRFGLENIIPNPVSTIRVTNREQLILELTDFIYVAQKMLNNLTNHGK